MLGSIPIWPSWKGFCDSQSDRFKTMILSSCLPPDDVAIPPWPLPDTGTAMPVLPCPLPTLPANVLLPLCGGLEFPPSVSVQLNVVGSGMIILQLLWKFQLANLCHPQD